MCYRFMQRQASMRKESDRTAAPMETRRDEPMRETQPARESAFSRFMADMKRLAQRERESSDS